MRGDGGEVDQLTRYGAAINVFMLGEDPGLRRFVDAIARRSGGRVFTPGHRPAGEYVVARLPAGPPRTTLNLPSTWPSSAGAWPAG